MGKPIYDEDFTCPFITKQIKWATTPSSVEQAENRSHNITQCVRA